MFTPIIAAITAFTISTQTDVPIKRVYVPIVVFGGELADLQDYHVSAVDAQDATDEQIQKAKELVIAAGIAPDRIQTWTQNAGAFSARDRNRKSVRLGVVMVDLGTPGEARTTASTLGKVRAPNLAFGWNEYAAVDCAAMERRVAIAARCPGACDCS